MIVKLSGPAHSVVSLLELKDHARVDHNDEDGKLAGLIEAATDYIEAAIGRSLINQQWRLTLSGFQDHIILPLPPCQSVDSVTYIDPTGTSQTLAADAYDVIGKGSLSKAMLIPAMGITWPDTKTAPNTVEIKFTAGFGPDWNHVPNHLRQAVTAHALGAYDMHSAYFPETDGGDSLQSIIDQYKVWNF